MLCLQTATRQILLTVPLSGIAVSTITNRLPISHPSSLALRASRVPTGSAAQKESCAPPGPTGHDIQKVADCLRYYLDMNGVVQLTAEEWEQISRGRFEAYVGAVYSANDIWESSYNNNLISVCWLALYGNDVYWGKSDRTARLKEDEVKCLTCLLSFSEGILWLKLLQVKYLQVGRHGI